MALARSRLAARPYTWTRTSQALLDVLRAAAAPGSSILEAGSATAHISYRLARLGYRVTLLDVRAEPIEQARANFRRARLDAEFHVEDFFDHQGHYDVVWNSGLIQCLEDRRRRDFFRHAASLADRMLLFYPDTDAPTMVRGLDPAQLAGVQGAVEYSVADVPLVAAESFDKIWFGRIPSAKIDTSFDMCWIEGRNKPGAEPVQPVAS